jgi:hypothetical protein
VTQKGCFAIDDDEDISKHKHLFGIELFGF